MFKDVEVPPLPAAVNQLIFSSPSIAAKAIKTVNSSLYSPRIPVADVKRAVTLLGLENLRSIILAFATMDALPKNPAAKFLITEPSGLILCYRQFWLDL